MSDRVLRDVPYACTRLGVSRMTLERLVRGAELAYVDLATGVDSGRGTKGLWRQRRLRVLDEDLEAFIARRRVPAAPREQPEPAREQPRAAVGRRGRAAVLAIAGSDRYR